MTAQPDHLVGVLPSVAATLPGYCRITSLEQAQQKGCRFVLAADNGALSLSSIQGKALPLCVDFVNGRLGFRLARGRARQETLCKAVLGRHAPGNTRVLDATAGLGRDAALLASAGCKVVMLERHPLLFALLSDGLLRAQQQEYAARLLLRQCEARVFLCSDAAANYDVIYLDPMFADQSSKAAVKKELAWLRQILGPADVDEGKQLLQLAREKAGRRVVVKRSAKADTLGGEPPTASLGGKAVRFDIYTPL